VRALLNTAANKRMHATRDTRDVIEFYLAGGRVMPSVRRLLVTKGEVMSFWVYLKAHGGGRRLHPVVINDKKSVAKKCL
jgi:hypothetical protein